MAMMMMNVGVAAKPKAAPTTKGKITEAQRAAILANRKRIWGSAKRLTRQLLSEARLVLAARNPLAWRSARTTLARTRTASARLLKEADAAHLGTTSAVVTLRKATKSTEVVRAANSTPPKPVLKKRPVMLPKFPGQLIPTQPVFPPTAQDVAPVPQLQGAMDRLIQQRDQFITMVANGQMAAAQAESTLANALNSGEGSAIVAQDQAAAQSWLQDASNALYQTEANYQQANQQQAAPAVEYEDEEAAPEPAEDDSDEAIQNEYEAGYPGGVEGLMGLGATHGETIQVHEQARPIRLVLKAELELYKRARTDFVRRQHRRKLEEGVRRAEPLLARARSMGIRGGQAEDLFKKVREVNEALGRPMQPVQPAQPSRPHGQYVQPTPRTTWNPARAAQLRAAQQQAARAQAQLRAARMRLAAQDRRLVAVPHLQSPGGQTSVRTLVQHRDQLQGQVAAGLLTASQAKTELAVAITSGPGAAVAAQAPGDVAAWQKTSETALVQTEQAKATDEAAAVVVAETASVETAVATPAEAAPKQSMLPVLIGAALGAGGGYMVAEDEDDQVTYAVVGGIAGLVLGCILKRVMKKRAEAVAAPVEEAVPPAPPSAAAPARPRDFGDVLGIALRSEGTFQRLRRLPQLQSPEMQAAVNRLRTAVETLAAKIERSELNSAQAKVELRRLLSSGEGSAITAQARAAVDEWREATDLALDLFGSAAAQSGPAPEEEEWGPPGSRMTVFNQDGTKTVTSYDQAGKRPVDVLPA